MAIYQGDIGVDNINIGETEVYEIYQGDKKVYPDNLYITITFNLNVKGIVTIDGYIPEIIDNTKVIFKLPIKTNYEAVIEAEHYTAQIIKGTTGYKPIIHNIELVWNIVYDTYTVTFPTDGVKVLFDGIEQGSINDGKLVVTIDDRESKNKYNVSFVGNKSSVYNTDGLTVSNINAPASGGNYDLRSNNIVKDGYTRIDYATSTGEITRNSSYNGNWIETVVNLKAAYSSSNTSLGTISNYKLIVPNNESESVKNGTFTVTFMTEIGGIKLVTANIAQTAGTKNYSDWTLNLTTDGVTVPAAGGIKLVTANIAQTAGTKNYSDWTLNLTTDGVTVPAAGGIKLVTANIAQRTYKWNNTGIIYSETAIPTLSVSGSATLNENQIIFTSNESISARSATLTASYVGLTKTVTITQSAGAKVYSAWSNWVISLSAAVQTLAASGGSTQLSTNASRTRTWTWNGVGTVYTENENGTPSLSGTSTGFILSGVTVTASNNESVNNRSINIVASYEGVTKSITISQSFGSKVYGEWSKWTINKTVNGTSIANVGGNGTISVTSAIRTRSYKWNNVGTSYTEQDNGSPYLVKQSGDGIVTINGTSAIIGYDNNATTNSKSTIIRAKIGSEYEDTTFTQAAGAKQYSNWSIWYINIPVINNIAASGGNRLISTSAYRTRTWTWNGVTGSGGTENENGNPTLSKISGEATLSNNTVTYGNNTTANERLTVIRSSIGADHTDINVKQNAGAKTYSTWSNWNINFTSNTTTIAASGGNAQLSYSASRSRTWQWNGVGAVYTENENKVPTISKINGAATLNNSIVSYSNNENTSVRNSIFRATVDTTTKDITISQSAGSKTYTNWSATNFTINITSTTAPAKGSSADLSGTYSRTRNWKWNNVGTSYIETDSGKITEWSSDTARTLVINGEKVMAVWHYNNTMQSRTAKFYAHRAEEISTNYVSYTQAPGILNGASYNYSSVQINYKGNILFNTRLDYKNYLRSTPSAGNVKSTIIIPNAVYTTKLYYRIRINIQAWWVGGSGGEESLVNPPFYGFLAETDKAPETGLYLVTTASNADYIKARVSTRHDIENDCYILDSIYKENANGFSANCSMCFITEGQRYTNAIIADLFRISLEGNQFRTNIIKVDFYCKDKTLYIKLNKVITPNKTRTIYFTNDEDSNDSVSIPSNNPIDTFINISSNFPISNYYYYNYITFIDNNIIEYNHYDKRINETGYGYER